MSPLFKRRKWVLKRPAKATIIKDATDAILTKRLYLNPRTRCIDVAKVIGTNRTYMWEALHWRGLGFQEFMGRFRIRYFIERAPEFRGLTTAEIAQKCGFGDVRSFHRYLKKMFGMTPTEYMEVIDRGL